MPEDLVASIDARDDRFQAFCNPDDPMDSGFLDEVTTTAWHERGERLAAMLPVRVELHAACGNRMFGG